MSVTIHGDTGVSKVQDGVVETADLAPSVKLGKVLQVVYGSYGTQVSTSSSTPVDIGLSATITPSSTSNKILCMCSINGVFVSNTASGFANFLLARNSTNLGSFGYVVGYAATTTSHRGGACGFEYLDSPASTAAITYKVQGWALNGCTVDFQRDNQAISSLVLMEIAA